jgi:Ca2+-binding RTX toxin-like protein
MKTQYLDLDSVKAQLTQLATQANFESIITTAFGTNIEAAKISQLRQDWLAGDFSVIPQIKILSNGELGGANGGYAASEDKIFISSDFLAQQQGNTQAVTGLLLEEIGHKIDRVFNGDVDSAGDEGDIFSRLASGQTLSAELLASLKVEDDSALITVGGKVVSIEQGGLFSSPYIGTEGDDTVIGAGIPGLSNDNEILGLGGNDTLYGNGGDDLLLGGADNDTLYGGDDDDRLYGESGSDRLYGESGTDYLNGGTGNDYLDGGSGDDRLYGGNDNDTLYGGTGNDSLSGEMGNDYLYGGNGNDSLFGGDGNDYIVGEAGDDKLYGDEGEDTLIGGTGYNSLLGGGSNDLLILGGLSYNTIDGGYGNDTYVIDANHSGGDTINETTVGGSGDTLDFSLLSNQSLNVDLRSTTTQYITNGLQMTIPVVSIENINGGAINDLLQGSNLDNLIQGNNGSDGLYGWDGNDTLIGGADNDSLYGGIGNDTLQGGSGIDYLLGDVGTDSLYGDGDNDEIYGGVGDDLIFGGAGNDYLHGGAGSDRFNFSTNGSPLSGTATVATLLGKDTIADFVSGTDKIVLSKSTFTSIPTVFTPFGSPSNFATVANDAAALTGTSSAVILYSSSTGNLFYNQNGTSAGLGTNGGNFATLTGMPNLVASDFVGLTTDLVVFG